MKVIRVNPNGRCLFIALRIALEAATVLRNVRMGQKTPRACFDGFDDGVIDSAESLAEIIFAWYSKKPTAAAEGSTDAAKESTKAAPSLRRMDILAAEMVAKGHEIEDTDAAKLAAAQRYLDIMRRPGEWGSTPEYLAFAFLSKLVVEVYQPIVAETTTAHLDDQFKAAGLMLIHSVQPSKVADPLDIVYLLYNGHDHYDCLVPDLVANELVMGWPEAKRFLRDL